MSRYLNFKEKSFSGDFEKAASILSEFDRRHPGYGVIALRRIGVERRLAQFQAGEGCVICFWKKLVVHALNESPRFRSAHSI